MPNEIKEVKSDLTEEDIKAFEEEEENKDESPEENTPPTKPEDIKPKEEPADTTPKEDFGDGLKDVPNETPRERALRLEVTRLRQVNRKKEQGDLINTTPVEEVDNSDEELKKLGYDDEQIVGLKKVVDIIASKQGYVKKSSTYKEMADETLNGFIEEHPEYSPENDRDDLYWGRFKTILASDYNLNGKTQKQLKSIFERVDRDVKEELGEKQLDKEKIEANKRKIGDISHGASGSSDTKPVAKKATSAGNKTYISSAHPNLVFKGFDEEEVEEFV